MSTRATYQINDTIFYIHGEYRDKNGFKWLSANKGDEPSIHTFGVKLKDIVWRKK